MTLVKSLYNLFQIVIFSIKISQLPWKYETVKLDEYDEPVENYAANATREPWATLANMDLQELCPPESDAHWTVNWYTSMNWMDSEKNENNREKNLSSPTMVNVIWFSVLVLPGELI